MKKNIFILTSLLVVKSFAFTLTTTNPNQEGWATKEITFLVNPTNCPIDAAALIADAASIWNDVAQSNVKISYGGSTTSTNYANPTTVYCETNFNGVTGADDNYVPGAASIQTTGNTISSGIIFLNASAGLANIGNYDYETLKIVIAHEIGHVLGLGHSADEKALMYYDAGAKGTLRLAQDDIDGISYLYPSNEFSDGKLAGCGRVGNLMPPPPSGGAKNVLALILLLLLPAVVTVRLKGGRPWTTKSA